MTKGEISNLIHEITNEIFQSNQSIVEDLMLADVIESAVKLSCAANIVLLQRLGLIDDELKPLS